MINQTTINDILDAAIIEDIVGEFVSLKKRGVNYLGLCPFHNEKTPSFTVSPAKGIYKCFGCGASGNSVKFLMEHEHFSYPEALKFIASKYNIEVEEEELSPEQKESQNLRESLYIVNKFATDYFKNELHNTNQGKAIGLSYFIERGFREDIIEKFELGYSPDEWDAFTNNALKEGHKLDYLEKSGLTIVKENKQFDRFKGRVMFPIHNLSGRVLGFGGRILNSNAKAAKYLNSPESEIYNKSKVLYGIYFAKKAIIQNDNCFLVEGYTDVISMFQAGIENVVSSSGTSLTEGQIRLIKRFTQNITILYDGDEAGLKASFRGIDMILQEGLNVKVVLFPDGEDPDSYAKKVSTEELNKYIAENAEDFIRFKTHVLIKDVGNDPIKRAELIKAIVESIAVIPDQIKRSVYTKECSNLLDISEQALINETNKILRKEYSKQLKQTTTQENYISPSQELEKESPKDSAEKTTTHWELEVIRLLLNYGDLSIEFEIEPEEKENNTEEEENIVKENIAVYIISNLVDDDISFSNAVYQEILNIYVEYLNKEEIPKPTVFTNHTNNKISEVAISLFSEKYDLSHNWEKKHNIYVKKESDLLKKGVINTIHSLKLAKLDKLIFENQEKLKSCTDELELLNLVKEQHILQNIKIKIADRLGRIILK